MSPRFFNRLSRSPYWRDIAWLASGNAGAQAIGLLAMPAMTRLYLPSDFALQNLFLQVIGFAVVILTWRYEYFIQLPKDNVDASTMLRLVFLLGVLGCIVATPIIWFVRDTLASWLGEPTLALWLVFVPITAMLISFSIGMQHFAQRMQKYRISSFSELANKGAYVSTALAGFWLLSLPAGLMIAPAAGAMGKMILLSTKRKQLTTTGNAQVQNSFISNTSASLTDILCKYSRLSGSMVFSHLMLSCTAIVPSVFIAHVYGSDALGQYALVASTVYLPSGLIAGAIGQVYYQRAAASWAQGESFIVLWRATAKRLVVIGAPIFIAVALVAPWAYPLVFGDAWQDAGQYAVLFSISAFFSFATVPLGRACLVVGVWWYLPSWHAGRMVSTALVVWLAWLGNWKIELFLIALVIQMSIMYLIDYWAEWRFALRNNKDM